MADEDRGFINPKGAAMSDTAGAPQTSVSGQGNPRRRFFRRAAIATAIAGVTAGLGIKAFAHAGGSWSWRHGAFTGAALDPAALDERLDRMLKHLYAEIDATDAQKQQLGPIVKGAAADLFPVRARMRDARSRAVTLLSQEHVDRAALEALRAEQLQLAEQASRRFTQALADVADVLSVDQRKQLAERIGRWRGHRG
jgi:periplasmic protein CpxP/Spy